MKKVVAVLAVLLIAGVVLTGCSVKALKESDVSFADGMVENVLVAETERNYDMWAKDMDETMLKVIPKDKFELLIIDPVSYTHLRAHETRHDLVCRLLL